MPRQYSPQFRERVLGLLDSGRPVSQLAIELGICEATIYRWRRQARIDAGLLPGTTSRDAVELADARKQIARLEEELRATRLAALILEDESVRPKGGSRSFRPRPGRASAPKWPARFCGSRSAAFMPGGVVQ